MDDHALPDRVDLAIRAGRLRDEVKYCRELLREFVDATGCDKPGCDCLASRTQLYLRTGQARRR